MKQYSNEAIDLFFRSRINYLVKLGQVRQNNSVHCHFVPTEKVSACKHQVVIYCCTTEQAPARVSEQAQALTDHERNRQNQQSTKLKRVGGTKSVGGQAVEIALSSNHYPERVLPTT